MQADGGVRAALTSEEALATGHDRPMGMQAAFLRRGYGGLSNPEMCTVKGMDRASPETIPAAAATQGLERRTGSIDLHLREVAQLFNSLDPCPFYERDLDADAEGYIVASAQAELANRELRVLLRRGWISLLIGLAFLGMLLGLSEVVVRQMTPSPLAAVLRESLVIGGWVALWRPLEIFLYDWWPIVGQRKTYAVLTSVPVNVVPTHESAH